MFEEAIKSGIPIIAVQTDDVVNLVKILQSIAAPLKVLQYPATKTGPLHPGLYYTFDADHVTIDQYKRVVLNETQLVYVNGPPNSLAFDAGTMPVPTQLVRDFLSEFMADQHLLDVQAVLKGLSLKSVTEIMRLTMARTGGCKTIEVRKTRSMVGGNVHGLYPVDTAIDFYVMPNPLQSWLDLNADFFLKSNVPYELVPRGVMMVGYPGVGKTLGSKAIANHFGIPLFRLDIATTIDKFQGVSENRLRNSLIMIERESPCVLLLDEVEKMFSGNDDTGVIQRMLSQLLWWLGDHRSKVLTVMTTNNLSVIPPELYRPGRVDFVAQIEKLKLVDAKKFVVDVFRSVLKKEPTTKQQHVLRTAIELTGVYEFAHSMVTAIAYDQIKVHGWNNP